MFKTLIASVLLATPLMAQTAPINLYTSNSAQSVDAVRDTARKLLPNQTINTITGGSAQLLRRIEAETAKPQADVFWSSSANTMGAFKPLFEAYASPALAAIPKNIQMSDNLFAPANIHVVVAMVNKNQLAGLPEPKTWAEMIDAKYKGKIIIADPANSSTAYTILWGIDKLLGAESLKKLAGLITVNPSAPNVLRAVGQGEFAIGLTFESNAYAYVAGGQKEISLVYPSDGTFVSPEYIALIKNAPSPQAKATYDFMLSKEVQIALLEAAFRRPSRSDIDVSKIVSLPELSTIKVFPVDEDDAAKQRADFLKRWQGYLADAPK